MAKHQETFEGCSIEITDNDLLTINGKEIHYEHNAPKNEWFSRYLPYTNYNSLLEMARAIARNTVEFSSTKQ